MTQRIIILMDIEGTTTDIHFVHRILFPYSREKMSSFIDENHRLPHVHDALCEALITLNRENTFAAKHPFEKEVSLNDAQLSLIGQHLCRWIDEDRKHPALKKIQGFIWRQGYAEGSFRGHVFPDVPKNLSAWRAKDFYLGIYSSGSVEAQKLLLGHTDYGDLNPLIDGYFDTGVGPKKSSGSYKNILRNALGTDNDQRPQGVFLTDVREEAEAALEGGFKVILLDRTRHPSEPINRHHGALDGGDIPVVHDFYAVDQILVGFFGSSS